MISYTLLCSKEHCFEASFRGSEAYTSQAKGGQIACPICGDTKVKKSPMAPAVTGGRRSETERAKSKTETDVDRVGKALRALRDHIEANVSNVGRSFPEEARRIHYGEANRKSIYGEANVAEARELHEEGIPCLPLPWPARRRN